MFQLCNLILLAALPYFFNTSVLAKDFNPIKSVVPSLKDNNKYSNKVGKILPVVYEPTSKLADYNERGEELAVSHQDIRNLLVKTQIIDEQIDNLNKLGLVLRQDIPVTVKDCDQPNAYWNRSSQEIIICYDNLSYDVFLFHKIGKLPLKVALEKSINETIFAFYHELGHALIELLPLNAVGQEEDTVDEFAAIMLLKSNNQDSPEIVLASAEYYFLIADSPPKWWGEHSPNLKRMFNLVCFVYGSDPESYAENFIATLQELETLNNSSNISVESVKRRASLCQQDYARKVDSWNNLLIPHYATQNQPWGKSSSDSPSPKPGNSSQPGKIW